MADVNGPLIVRRPPPAYFAKPGIHSHNVTRRIDRGGAGSRILRLAQALFLLLGLCGLGYYGYTLTDQYVYQAYQNWSFDQQIAGRRGVTFADYLRERTPFGFLVGTSTGTAPGATTTLSPAPAATPSEAPPPEGSLLGRVEIPRLNLSAMVRQGVDAGTLGLAVGHVPSTSLPGQVGNFAIAAHRDTLFRALKDIKKDDLVTFESPAGNYTYQVLATKIVKPSDVSVLRSDGGGLISQVGNGASASNGPDKLLTMITCYPFYYVGSAPKRFIVEARLVPGDAPARSIHGQNIGPPPPDGTIEGSSHRAAKSEASKQTTELRRDRSSSHLRESQSVHSQHTKRASAKPSKKRGFWHKVFHVS